MEVPIDMNGVWIVSYECTEASEKEMLTACFHHNQFSCVSCLQVTSRKLSCIFTSFESTLWENKGLVGATQLQQNMTCKEAELTFTRSFLSCVFLSAMASFSYSRQNRHSLLIFAPVGTFRISGGLHSCFKNWPLLIECCYVVDIIFSEVRFPLLKLTEIPLESL